MLVVFAFWAGGAIATTLWIIMDVELLRRDGSFGHMILLSLVVVVFWFLVLPYIALG